MSLDAGQIGLVAAKVMEDLDDDVEAGRLPEDARIVAALVVYEVAHGDDDGGAYSRVGGRVTDDRNVVGLGLCARMQTAMLDPDDDD